MHRPSRTLPLLAFLALPATLSAQEEYVLPTPEEYAERAERAENSPLFAAEDPIRMTLRTDIKWLRDERSDSTQVEGTLTFVDIDGSESVTPLQVRARGNFRRDKANCNFPPLRFNFKPKDVEGSTFEGQDKLKLVTHCKDWDKEYESLVEREYLAYRLLHELTAKSFGVRLLRITYMNTEDSKKRTKLGFVIEEDKAVAKRNGLKTVETGLITQDYLEHEQEILIHVFQYMIGNTEYSLTRPEPDKNCCHNIALLSESDQPPFIPVAYDFDFAGLVNAPYAQPNPRYNLRDVRVRLYKGECKYDEPLRSTLNFFIAKKADLYRIIDETESTTRNSWSSARSYIDNFYERISDPEQARKWLIDKCYKE